jgi:ABC-type multidrug transport system ATPase subunit
MNKPIFEDVVNTFGDAYALLGHNGSGQTTTLRLGWLEPDSGRISVFGG